MVFRDAQPADDPQLTRLMAKAMPGDLSLSLSREPSFLDSCAHCGPPRRVLTAEHENELVALCTYFPWTFWQNGEKREIWTVADFRAQQSAAHRSVTGRGWKALRERLGQKPAIISVVDDNPISYRLFSKARPYWPGLHKLASLKTLILPLWTLPSLSRGVGLLTPKVTQIVECLRQRVPRYDFFPVLDEESIGGVTPPVEEFVACFDGCEVLACGALWDPSRFRQVRVEAYGGWYARLRQLGLLPPPGTEVRAFFAAFLGGSCASSVRRVFRELLRRAQERGAHFLVWGGDQNAPAPFPSYWPHFTYKSSLFQLLWEGDKALPVHKPAAYEVAWL